MEPVYMGVWIDHPSARLVELWNGESPRVSTLLPAVVGTGRAMLRHTPEFMADESCGKCVPCRVGTQRALELVGDNGLTSDGAQTPGGC